MDYSATSDEELRNLYTITKDEMEYQDSLSLSLKIFLNSQYGSNALPMNAFSNGRLTNASVTLTGRLLTQTIAAKISNEVRKYLGEEPTSEITEVVQADTDSAYLTLDRLIEKKLPNASEDEILEFIQKFFHKKLAPVINEGILEIATKLNFMTPDVLKMDQEIVSNSFVSVASKRYFTRILMSDGNKLAKPKVKVTGISLISKSTPGEVKKILKPTLDFFLDDNKAGLTDYLKSHHKGFDKLPVGLLAKAQSVTSLDYDPYYEKRPVSKWEVANKFCKQVKDNKKSKLANVDKPKGVKAIKVDKLNTAPLNSKGSIVHNYLIEQFGLQGKYELIEPHDKIKVIYLHIPNPITHNHNAIAFKDAQAIKDLGLEQYVDFSLVWEKELISKVDIIAEKLKWDVNVRTSKTEELTPW